MKIIHGDCLKVMCNILTNSIDLGLCDPPYQIGYIDMIAQQSYKARGLDKKVKPIKNDSKDSIDWDVFFDESYRILKPKKMLYMCCRLDMIVEMGYFIKRSKFEYAHDFVWHKGDMGYGNLNIMGTTHELIIGLSKEKPEKSRPIYVDGVLKKRTPAFYVGKLSKSEYYGHPTQKPVGMMVYLIQNRTDEGDVVLDAFAGVGSTLVAAKLLDRNYIGIELDEEHYKNILKRLNDEEHLSIYKEMLSNGLSVKNSGVTYNLVKPKEVLKPAYLEWVHDNMISQSYGLYLQKLVVSESGLEKAPKGYDAKYNNDLFEIKVSYLNKSKNYRFIQTRQWEPLKGYICLAINPNDYKPRLFYLTHAEVDVELTLIGSIAHSNPDSETPEGALTLPPKGIHWDRWLSKYLVKGGIKNLIKVIYNNDKRGMEPDQATIFNI